MKKNSMTKLRALMLCAVMALGLFAGCASKTTETSAAPATTETTEAAAETTTEEAAPAEDASSETEEPAAEEAADGLLAQIKAKGKLTVGTEAQYAPYEFKDLEANFAGCDMWLAQQIADAIGVELEVVDMSFDGIIPAV